jgi:transglutaminase-like putative cysteine protease
MVRLEYTIDLSYQVADPCCDFIFMFHAAQTQQQRLVHETLKLNPSLAFTLQTNAHSRNRILRLSAPTGPLKVSYSAVVEVHHHCDEPASLRETPVRLLPAAVLPFLLPSRYCQSDRLQRLALKEFGSLTQGYGRAKAICDWVNERVTFASNSSTAETSALDTLIDEAGVCRDFAHLMIALCRAVNLPARFVSGIDYGADPALGPLDFHAYVEVFLGERWYMFDPSGNAIPMGFVRMATGRDAADCAFATMFGMVESWPPMIHIEAVPDGSGMLNTPRHVSEALSTDAEPA